MPIPWRWLFSKHFPRRSLPSLAWLVLLLLAGLSPVNAQVTLEIVNDTGLPDSNVFVKVPGYYITGQTGQPMVPANLFVDLSNSTPPNPASIPLSDLATGGSAAPYAITSTITGNTNTVYSIQIDYINSGAIYFTYNSPFWFTNKLTPSPPPDSHGNAWRFDYAEFTINDANAQYNAVDVTYVDKFGIPLQLEWFSGTNLAAGSYVYSSTKTLVDQFTAAGLGNAAFALNASNITSGWHYTGPDSYTNFARILAPQKVSGTNHSVAPYPNIAYYLDSLVGASNSFWLNGASPQAGYNYLGYNVSLSTNPAGWLVTLAKTPGAPPYDPNQITGIPYTATLTFPIAFSNASQYVYGAPVGINLYSVNGVLVTDPSRPTYAVETWMIGDVLSAINFGFWGGVYGTNSADWYSRVKWTAFPFGAARAGKDGYYNPYAALLYNNADPYGFAFSERITPDVLMAPTNGDRVRITLLPDDRLDAPLVTPPAADAIGTNFITLSWQPVAGASGYVVNVLRPYGLAPVSLSSGAASGYTLTNLQTGAPYVMTVQAVGHGANGNPIITPARPVFASTAGITAPTAGDLTQIQVTFSAADPFYQLAAIQLNGIELRPSNGQWLDTNGIPARWLAAAGTNQVVVTALDPNRNVLFSDWLTFNLARPFTVTNGLQVTTNSAISDVVLHGQKASQPPPTIDGFLNGTATNFVVSAQNVSLVIGLTYVPSETRRYSSVTAAPPSISLYNVNRPTEGNFQFNFDLPYGVAYSVQASTNLTAWQTVSNGYGQFGASAYSAPHTNHSQFFRLQY